MKLKVILNPCNIHNSGNIACFNYSAFTQIGKCTRLAI